MSKYAEHTRVPVSQTRNEIERTLERYGADGFLYAHETGRAVIGFRMQNRNDADIGPIVILLSAGLSTGQATARTPA